MQAADFDSRSLLAPRRQIDARVMRVTSRTPKIWLDEFASPRLFTLVERFQGLAPDPPGPFSFGERVSAAAKIGARPYCFEWISKASIKS
jgi:hypothetical protein